MAAGDFTPDLLLTVGADITALRQQLAVLGQQLGDATTIRVNVQAATGGATQLEQSLNNVKRTSVEAAAALTDIEKAIARDAALTTRWQAEFAADTQKAGRTAVQAMADYEAAIRRTSTTQIRATAEYEAVLRRMGVTQTVAVAENEARTRSLGIAQVRAAAEYEVVLRRLGVTQSAALAENEARVRRLGVAQVQAATEYDAILRRLGVTQSAALADNERRTRQLGLQQVQAAEQYEVALRRLGVAQAQAYQQNAERETAQQLQRIRNLDALERQLLRMQTISAAASVPAGAAAQLSALQGARGVLQGGGTLSSVEMAQLTAQTNALGREFAALNPKVSSSHSALSTLFGRFGRYAQIAGLLTVTYGSMRLVFSAVTEFEAVDKILHQIAATMELGADRTAVLKQSWELMVEANQTLGVSFQEAGKVVFELEKALGNNAEQIRGAFLPALVLASLGEGNQTEIIRTLIGLYKVFGDTLGDTSPQEKYLAISDKLVAAAASSIQDIDGFRTALQNVAPIAAAANVSLDSTLAILILLTNGLQSASRAGTGFRALIVDLEQRGPQIAKALSVPFDLDAPLDAVKLLDLVIRRIKEMGTTSLETQLAVSAAFPDKRAALALETLVKLWDDYPRALDDVAKASGRTAMAQKELSETVSAAMGRLGGAALKGIVDGFNELFSVKPGDASGLTQAIDSVAGTVLKLAVLVSGAVKGVKELLALVPLGLTPTADRAEADRKAFNDLFGPPAVDKAAADNLARANAQRQEAAANLELDSGGPVRAQEARGHLTEQINKRIAEQNSLVAAELALGDRTLALDVRLAAAQQLLALRRTERLKAENDFRAAVMSRAEATDIEQAGAKRMAALNAEMRVQKEVLAIKKEGSDADIAFSTQQAKSAEAGRKALEAFDGHLDTQQGKLKNLTASQKFDSDEFGKLLNRLDELSLKSISPEEWSERVNAVRKFGEAFRKNLIEPLLEITRTDQENALEKLLRSMRDTALEADNLRSKLGAEATSGLSGGALPTGIEAASRLAERAVGLDKIRDAVTALQAHASNSFAQILMDTAAAGLGFDDFSALVERAVEKADPNLQRLVDAIRKIPDVTADLQKAQVAELIRQNTNALADQVGTFGRLGVEAERYLLARKHFQRSYAELGPAEQAEIEALARQNALLREQVTIRGLVLAGLDAQTASELALVSAEQQEFLSLQQSALRALDTLTSFSQKVAENNAELQAQFARAAGNPFAFFLASLNSAALKAGDFWASLRTFASDTAKQMSSSLSDFFFAKFTGQLTSAKELFKAFTDSMLRAIANFLAQAVVQQFLSVLLGTGGGVGGFGGVFGGGGGGGGAASGAGGLSAAAVQGLASGVVSGAAGSGGGLFGFNLNTLFGTGTSVAGSTISAATGQGGLLAGIVNAPANFSAGGLGAVAVGQAPVYTAAELAAAVDEAGLLGGVAGTETGATSGLVGSGGAVASATVVLAAIAAAWEIYQGIQGLSSNIPSQQNAAIGGLSGVAAGAIVGTIIYPGIGTIIGAALGGAVGDFLGGLFGSDKPRLSHAQREALEANRALAAAGGFQGAIASQTTPTGLFNTLVAQQSGYVGGTAPTAINVGIRTVMTREQFLASVAAGDILLPTGQTAEQVLSQQQGVGAGGAPHAQTLDQIKALIASGDLALPTGVTPEQVAGGGFFASAFGVGRQNPTYPVYSQQGFLKAAAESPQDIFAGIQQGVNPNLLSGANTNLAATIQAAVTNVNTLGAAINRALAEILAQTVVPASEKLGQQVREQAAAFRLIVNALIVDNIAQQNRVKLQLQAATDPVKILEYTNQIKTLIESRYNDEISLVKKFGDALDQLAVNFTKISASITQQINALQLSNFGPTNPLALYQSAQATFDKAKAAFTLNPTPENAQAVQAAVDDVIRKASEVYSRPSPEFRAIFNSTIGVLEDVRTSVDKQATDITSALAIALGTGNSIADLTQQNTAKMAADMAVLRTLVEQQLVGLGFQLPGVVALPGNPVVPGVPGAPIPSPVPSSAGSPASASPVPPQTASTGFEVSGFLPDAVLGSFQEGAWFTRGGLYRLHEGEMVLPARVASSVRSGGSGGGSVTLLISPGAIVVNGAQDPALVSQEIMDKIEKAVRTGKLGRVIAQRVQ